MIVATCVDGYRGPFARQGSWLLSRPLGLGQLPGLLRPDPSAA
jgi:hypothetical protein